MKKTRTVDDLEINPLNVRRNSFQRRTCMKVNQLYFNYMTCKRINEDFDILTPVITAYRGDNLE